MTFLEYQHQKKFGTPLRTKFQKGYAENIQKQNDSYDCGVFLCWYARRLCEEEPCYSPEDVMNGRRATLQKEILTCSLINDNYDKVGGLIFITYLTL